jgi:large repetitive protein
MHSCDSAPATAALAAAAVLTAIALAPTQAFADHVSCGDVITEDTTLDSDLFCPANAPALEIGADHVELDLGGNDVSVSGTGVLNEGYDHVTVRNGSAGFGVGIVISDADHNRVEDVTGGGYGGGLLLERSDHNRILGNRFEGDDFGGLQLWDGSDDNVIERNRLFGGLSPALSVYGSDGNLIRRNALFGSHTASLRVGPGADGTTVSRNDFDGQAGGLSPPGDGIVVDAETTNTLLVRNDVRGFTGSGFPVYVGDGIRVESPSTTITRNVSNDNGRWGILAVPGVIDGGGNTASGNGLGQCLNVSC